jgi:hypothetical protein
VRRAETGGKGTREGGVVGPGRWRFWSSSAVIGWLTLTSSGHRGINDILLSRRCNVATLDTQISMINNNSVGKFHGVACVALFVPGFVLPSAMLR